MKKFNGFKSSLLIIAIFIAAFFIGWKNIGKFEPEGEVALNNYYESMKNNCANHYDIFYQDFNGAFTEVDSAQNQWSIGGYTWWFPHHGGVAPQVQDSSLILSSVKNESTSTFTKQEAQTMDSFSLPENGEFIIGLWSERWESVPVFDDDYWADSSVGLEIFIGSAHYAIVFVYGHLGVFYDPTGDCQHPDAVCQYAQVDGWATIAPTTKPIAIRIAWTTQGNNKTFELYIITENNEDTSPRATISNVNYIGAEGLRIRLNANVTNTDKEPPSDSETLKIDYVCLRSDVGEIPPEISLSHTRFNFGEILSVTRTTAQTLLIDNTGSGTLNWTATPSDNWIQVDPSTGTDNGEVSVSVDATGLSAGMYTGTITVSDPHASNSPQTAAVTLTVYQAGKTNAPFGQFATPTDGSTVSSSIAVTGWALDDIGIESVKIYSGDIYIGDALLVEGARTDIEQAYPAYPRNYQAGWGYMLLTNFLPNGGNGVYTLNTFALDVEGNQVLLGSKTITVDNVNAVKPFGAIDTPAQGGTASGSTFKNQGWVLTPMPNKIPEDGSTIEVYVDSVKLGNPQYNIPRSDIATYFPGYANSHGPAAVFTFDTTAYSNGIHTIFWIAKDNAGNADGIGSRFFKIQNSDSRLVACRQRTSSVISEKTLSNIPVDYSGPVGIRRGYGKNMKPETIYPDDNGIINIEIKELERLEIRFNNDYTTDESSTGSSTVNIEPRTLNFSPLPIGSTLDTQRGIFYWLPGPGFLGEYPLVFVEIRQNEDMNMKNILIKILPKCN
jgi:hypothetical protein